MEKLQARPPPATVTAMAALEASLTFIIMMS
jgi:hypothetical protein